MLKYFENKKEIELLDYNEITGAWKIQVKHFTNYGNLMFLENDSESS